MNTSNMAMSGTIVFKAGFRHDLPRGPSNFHSVLWVALSNTKRSRGVTLKYSRDFTGWFSMSWSAAGRVMGTSRC